MKLHKSLITVTPFSKALTLIIFVALPFVTFYLGMLYQRDLTPQVENIIILKPLLTANWKVYTNDNYNYTFKYPSNWTVNEKNTEKDVYDPATIQNAMPVKFFNVLSAQISSQTPVQAAEVYQQQNSDSHQTVSINIQTINGLDVVLYNPVGQGANGNNLLISNGKILVRVNTSMKNLNNSDVENQILSTFKFTQ